MKFQSLTIRARLLLLALGLIIPFAAAELFSLWSFRQASRAQLDESLKRQAQLAAKVFEQRIAADRQTLETIAALAESGEASFTLQDYLDSIVKTRPNWLDVQIVDRDGAPVLAQKNKRPKLSPEAARKIKDEAERENSFVVSTEQANDRRLNALTLAMPAAGGNFVVARIDGASVSDVFEKLDLPDDNLIAVFDRNGRLLYRNRPLPEPMSLDAGEMPLFTAINERREAVIEVESPYDRVQRVYGLARADAANTTVAVAVPSERLYEPARREFLRQSIFGLLVAALAIAAAYWIARGITRPMRRLTGAAKAFGAGEFEARAEQSHGGSIGELGRAFNRMAEEIAGREEKLKQLDRLKSEFVSSVSHELRTPLTTIKTLTSVLLRDGKISAAEREEFLRTIAVECDRQIDFVEKLLDLSRIEAGAYQISPRPTDVVSLLLETIEPLQRTAILRGLRLEFKPPPEQHLPFAQTDAGALRRVVSSLVENALKYTPEGGAITVAARQAGERIAIEITDDGCGIRAEDLPRVFEKFFRGRPLENNNPASADGVGNSDGDDCDESNETAGTGLGLYLAKNLVEQIGGEITAESPVAESRSGSRFTILLPVFKNSE